MPGEWAPACVYLTKESHISCMKWRKGRNPLDDDEKRVYNLTKDVYMLNIKFRYETKMLVYTNRFCRAVCTLEK